MCLHKTPRGGDGSVQTPKNRVQVRVSDLILHLQRVSATMLPRTPITEEPITEGPGVEKKKGGGAGVVFLKV